MIRKIPEGSTKIRKIPGGQYHDQKIPGGHHHNQKIPRGEGGALSWSEKPKEGGGVGGINMIRKLQGSANLRTNNIKQAIDCYGLLA